MAGLQCQLTQATQSQAGRKRECKEEQDELGADLSVSHSEKNTVVQTWVQIQSLHHLPVQDGDVGSNSC